MHSWSDDRVDWKGISDAARFIGTNLRRWGRMDVRDWKEKWGTPRVYCSMGWHQVFNLTHPGHMFNRSYPKWLWALDCHHGDKITRILNRIAVPYHMWLYSFVYGLAIMKWQHLRQEILCGADHPELLGKYGMHVIRTSSNGYEIRMDWHETDWKERYPEDEEEDAVLPVSSATSNPAIRRIK